MTKRRILLVGLVSMATAACAAIAIAYVFRDPINDSTCAKIQKGMTEAEVIQILGRPCDSSCQEVDLAKGMIYGVLEQTTFRTWAGSAGSISVRFIEPGIVDRVAFHENENSVWWKFRRALGLEAATLPGPHYLGGVRPMYFPPSAPYPLPKELESLEEAAKKAFDHPEPE